MFVYMRIDQDSPHCVTRDVGSPPPLFTDLPYRIRLLTNRIVRADILYQIITYSNHILQVLNYRRTEVYCEILFIVVSSSMPALYSIVFVLLFVVHQWWHCHSVEIVEIAIDGVVDLTWLDWFRVRCKRCSCI